MGQYILIITLHADPAMPAGYEEWGGTHAYMRELLDMCNEHHIHAILITRLSIEGLPDYEQYGDYCKVYRLINGGGPKSDKHDLIDYHNENLIKIKNIIKKQDDSLICIHSVYWNSGRIAMEISESIGVPFVHSVISNSLGRNKRGATPDIPERAFFERQIYHSTKYVLCVSRDEANDLKTLYDVPSEKLVVAGQFISYYYLNPLHDQHGIPRVGLTPNTSVEAPGLKETYDTDGEDIATFSLPNAFTYLGRIATDKGVDIIIKAWYRLNKKLGEKCPPLWLVGGSYPEIHDMRKLLNRDIPDLSGLEQNGNVVWWGYLDSSSISTLLMKTIAMVTHSRYEPGGRVVIEAMSEGIPVIAAPKGFANDIIIDWRNGFLVEYGDIDNLAKRMELFIRNPLLHDSLSKNASYDAGAYRDYLGFVKKHIFAYGLNDSTSDSIDLNRNEYTRCCDTSRIRPLSLHPYTRYPLTDSFYYNYIKSITQAESICRIDDNIFIADGKLIRVKEYISHLNLDTLYSPVIKNEYVHHSIDLLKRDVYARKQLFRDSLIDYDDNHMVVVTNAIDGCPTISLDDIPYVFKHLTEEYGHSLSKHVIFGGSGIKRNIPELEKIISYERASHPDICLNGIRLALPELYPDMIYHTYVANREYMSDKSRKLFKSASAMLSLFTSRIREYDIQLINLWSTPYNLIKIDKYVCPEDLSGVSLGPKESAFAVYIFYYIKELSQLGIERIPATFNTALDLVMQNNLNPDIWRSELVFMMTEYIIRSEVLSSADDITIGQNLLSIVISLYNSNP